MGADGLAELLTIEDYLYCPGVCKLREFCGVTRRCLRNIRYFEARQLHS